MKLDHVAIWAVDIESMRSFYEKYFDARSTRSTRMSASVSARIS